MSPISPPPPPPAGNPLPEKEADGSLDPVLGAAADKTRRWLFDQFGGMGFSHAECAALIRGRNDHHLVRKMLGQGASHAQVLDILL